MTQALTGIDVVFSTLAAEALDSQVPLAEAAKASGVQIFVPSEYGKPTEGAEGDNMFGAKSSIHTVLRKLDLAYTLVFTGPFSDWCFIPYEGLLCRFF